MRNLDYEEINHGTRRFGTHGVGSNTPYSHFSLLKTLEAGFGLPCLNHACDANVNVNVNVMTDMFQNDHHH